MTENEAIEELHRIRPYGGIIPQRRAEALDVAIKALEEVQQYRAIGTPEECHAVMEKQEMSKIVDGITECCGYDFGADGFSREIARYCPMCGRKLDWSDEDGN